MSNGGRNDKRDDGIQARGLESSTEEDFIKASRYYSLGYISYY